MQICFNEKCDYYDVELTDHCEKYGGGVEKCLNFVMATQKVALRDTQEMIADACDQVKSILLDKNRKYGDAALNPKRIFSKVDTMEQINVRIDDKISRIQSAQNDDTEDAELDLIGYLILKRVKRLVKTNFEENL